MPEQITIGRNPAPSMRKVPFFKMAKKIIPLKKEEKFDVLPKYEKLKGNKIYKTFSYLFSGASGVPVGYCTMRLASSLILQASNYEYLEYMKIGQYSGLVLGAAAGAAGGYFVLKGLAFSSAKAVERTINTAKLFYHAFLFPHDYRVIEKLNYSGEDQILILPELYDEAGKIFARADLGLISLVMDAWAAAGRPAKANLFFSKVTENKSTQETMDILEKMDKKNVLPLMESWSLEKQIKILAAFDPSFAVSVLTLHPLNKQVQLLSLMESKQAVNILTAIKNQKKALNLLYAFPPEKIIEVLCLWPQAEREKNICELNRDQIKDEKAKNFVEWAGKMTASEHRKTLPLHLDYIAENPKYLELWEPAVLELIGKMGTESRSDFYPGLNAALELNIGSGKYRRQIIFVFAELIDVPAGGKLNLAKEAMTALGKLKDQELDEIFGFMEEKAEDGRVVKKGVSAPTLATVVYLNKNRGAAALVGEMRKYYHIYTAPKIENSTERKNKITDNLAQIILANDENAKAALLNVINLAQKLNFDEPRQRALPEALNVIQNGVNLAKELGDSSFLEFLSKSSDLLEFNFQINQKITEAAQKKLEKTLGIQIDKLENIGNIKNMNEIFRIFGILDGKWKGINDDGLLLLKKAAGEQIKSGNIKEFKFSGTPQSQKQTALLKALLVSIHGREPGEAFYKAWRGDFEENVDASGISEGGLLKNLVGGIKDQLQQAKAKEHLEPVKTVLEHKNLREDVNKLSPDAREEAKKNIIMLVQLNARKLFGTRVQELHSQLSLNEIAPKEREKIEAELKKLTRADDLWEKLPGTEPKEVLAAKLKLAQNELPAGDPSTDREKRVLEAKRQKVRECEKELAEWVDLSDFKDQFAGLFMDPKLGEFNPKLENLLIQLKAVKKEMPTVRIEALRTVVEEFNRARIEENAEKLFNRQIKIAADFLPSRDKKKIFTAVVAGLKEAIRKLAVIEQKAQEIKQPKDLKPFRKNIAEVISHIKKIDKENGALSFLANIETMVSMFTTRGVGKLVHFWTTNDLRAWLICGKFGGSCQAYDYPNADLSKCLPGYILSALTKLGYAGETGGEQAKARVIYFFNPVLHGGKYQPMIAAPRVYSNESSNENYDKTLFLQTIEIGINCGAAGVLLPSDRTLKKEAADSFIKIWNAENAKTKGITLALEEKANYQAFVLEEANRWQYRDDSSDTQIEFKNLTKKNIAGLDVSGKEITYNNVYLVKIKRSGDGKTINNDDNQ